MEAGVAHLSYLLPCATLLVLRADGVVLAGPRGAHGRAALDDVAPARRVRVQVDVATVDLKGFEFPAFS